MDLLESGTEREPVRLSALLAATVPAWAVRAVAAGVAVVLTAGVAGAVVVERRLEREAARPDVDVRVLDSSSTTVGGVGRGSWELQLVNRGRDAVLVDLGFEVEGLRLTQAVEPVPPLAPGGRRELRVAYLIPSCASLVLPGRVLLRVQSGRERLERVLPVIDPRTSRPAPDAIPLAACPSSARAADLALPTDVGARPAGGSSRREGRGAVGIARLEVRNGGPAVRLLSVDARVPGVEFAPRVFAGGLELPPDGLAIVGLRFRVPECTRLQMAGWLVLRIERFGGVQEIGLRVTAEPVGGLGPQAPLPVVLGACEELLPDNKERG